MSAPQTAYNPETGHLFFGVPVEFGEVVVQTLRKAGLVDLRINQRHFINMERGERGYYRGVTDAPYITANLNFLKNELHSYEIFEFRPVSDPQSPNLTEEGTLTISKIAQVLDIAPTN